MRKESIFSFIKLENWPAVLVLPILAIGLAGCVDFAVELAEESLTIAAVQVGIDGTANYLGDKGEDVIFQPKGDLESPILLAVIDGRISQRGAAQISPEESEKIQNSVFPCLMENDRHIVEDLAIRLQLGLEAAGAEIQRMGTIPGENIHSVVEMHSGEEPGIIMVVIFRRVGIEIFSGGTRYRLYWDVELRTHDSDGELLASKRTQSCQVRKMEYAGWIGKAVRRFQEKFDELYADPEIAASLLSKTDQVEPI